MVSHSRSFTPYSTNAYVTINEDENRDPYEVFITVGKAGSDLQAQAESIGRLISKSLQIMPSTNSFEGLREIVHQLVGIGGNRSSGFGPNQVRSLPDAIGSAIMKMYFDKREQLLASYKHLYRKISSSFQRFRCSLHRMIHIQLQHQPQVS